MRAALYLLGLVLLFAAVATVFADGPNYGSYVASCDSTSTEVTFTNYDQQNCQGTVSSMSKPLNQCSVEFLVLSWNAKCNDTHIYYQNFFGRSCSGSSLKTRTYETGKCFNCPNAECKNPN
eukprot:gnl/Hemi2/13179_TR4509_c0_g1_i1.p3 gnl/Hemi2/13179_TR4509_c0_g1~~gnl/Hemi2/13179_TR4509_c0_g1_i1.p3  ORF type:complete len:139 (+),score=68.12 gnl/Hemi2/13179_TR4509_c0_g1_i1:57-419(+)